jgi:hypothetical protein
MYDLVLGLFDIKMIQIFILCIDKWNHNDNLYFVYVFIMFLLIWNEMFISQ